MNSVCYVNAKDWLDGLRSGQVGARKVLLSEEHPKVEAIPGAQGLDGVVKFVEGGNNPDAAFCVNHHSSVLRVAVAFNQARLEHPVQKFFETGMVLCRLVRVGMHLLWRMPARVPCDKEAAA